MEAINCSECKDEKCLQRIEGALCMRNKQTLQLIKMYETRDPILISRNLIEILGTEKERYDKAVKQENIGVIKKKKVVTKDGDVVDVEYESEPNPVVTDMAKSLIRSGKIIHDIVNPPKATPLFQMNVQNNYGASIANEIMTLPEEERAAQIKFIDDKLNA